MEDFDEILSEKTDLIKEIASSFKVDCLEVLTGFKWIGIILRKTLRGCQEALY